jgi:hypothetical protein
MCCCGLNTILNLPANIADKSNGAAVDVSGLQATKTVEISGTYSGTYSILASHDGNLYFPVAYFNSGSGKQTVRRTLEVAASFMKVHREAPQSGLVTVNIAARSTVACITSGQSGTNNFFTLATLPKGASGPQPALDMFALVTSNGVDVTSVACGGAFRGQISVESSLDGVNFSPIGSFLSSQSQRGSGEGTSMFDPIVVREVVRFVRANVLPGTVVTGPTSLTLGGPQNCDCSSGCAPIDLHADGTQGSFTLVGASTDPLILATFPYNFTCSNKANVELFGTVDSKIVAITGSGPVFPTYGIFIVTVVPPANELFSLITPDVLISTTEPADTLFHTFTGTNTIPNPAGPRFVIFAVEPDTLKSQFTVPETYNYKNFILDVLGI